MSYQYYTNIKASESINSYLYMSIILAWFRLNVHDEGNSAKQTYLVELISTIQ